MSNKTPYMVLSGTIAELGEDGSRKFRKRGDTVLLTEDQAKRLRNQVRAITTAVPVSQSLTSLGEDGKKPANVPPSKRKNTSKPVPKVAETAKVEEANTTTTAPDTGSVTTSDFELIDGMAEPDVLDLIKNLDNKDMVDKLHTHESEAGKRKAVLLAAESRFRELESVSSSTATAAPATAK